MVTCKQEVLLWVGKVHTYGPELAAGNKVVVLSTVTNWRFCKVKVTCICIMPEVPVSLCATLTNLFYNLSNLHG